VIFAGLDLHPPTSGMTGAQRSRPGRRAKFFVLVLAATHAFGPSNGCRKEIPSRGGLPSDAGNFTGWSEKPIRIAMIAKSSSNPSFLSARRGAEDRARDLSRQIGVPIAIDWLTPSQEDGQVQAQRILQGVKERVDAILISCSDDKKVSDAIDDAVARGIIVMTFDSDAPRSRRFSHVGVDDFKVGQQVIAELAALLHRQDKGSDDAGARGRTRSVAKIAILAGNRSAPNLIRRVEGATSEAARHPEIRVVGTFFHVETPQDASAEVQRVQTAQPDIVGWAMLGGWPLYNKTLLGDMQGDAGKARFKIVSVDALPPQLIYVERGLAPVLLAQATYLWGAIGVEMIVNKLVLKKPVPELIPMDVVRVTASNLGPWARQLKAWEFGDVPEEYLRLR
jgi:ribose transport system substrate-binding protein